VSCEEARIYLEGVSAMRDRIIVPARDVKNPFHIRFDDEKW
jgi:hypothetical protein